MRIKSILAEQVQTDKEYDPIIIGVTSVAWETLGSMYGKPINESGYDNTVVAVRNMIFQTALNLNTRQQKRFFETLKSPTDEILIEGLNYRVAKNELILESTTIYKMMVEAELVSKETLEKLKKGTSIGTALKGGLEMLGRGARAAVDTVKNSKIGKAIANSAFGQFVGKTMDFILNWVNEKLTALGGFVTRKFNEAAAWFTKQAEKEKQICGGQENSSLLYTGSPLYEAPPAELTDDQGDRFRPFSSEYLKELTTTRSEEIKAFSPPSIPVDPENPGNTKIAASVAKAIAIMKGENIRVKGANFREILSQYAKPNATDLMSEWYAKNNMHKFIAAAEGKPVDMSGSGCDMSSFDTKGEATKLLFSEAATLKNKETVSAWESALSYVKENKFSVLLTIAGIFASLASNPLGSLRVIGMVFASLIPLLVRVRVKNLEMKGAPQKQIEFWQKIELTSQIVGNLFALFNITTWIVDGWNGVGNSLDKVPTGEEELAQADASAVAAAEKATGVAIDGSDLLSLDKLDATAAARFTELSEQGELTGILSNLNDPEIVAQMSNEQFTALQHVLNAPKLDTDIQKALMSMVMSGESTPGSMSVDSISTSMGQLSDKLASKTFTMNAFNGLELNDQKELLRSMATPRADGTFGRIPDTIWEKMTAAEKAAKAAAEAAKASGSLDPALEPADAAAAPTDATVATVPPPLTLDEAGLATLKNNEIFTKEIDPNNLGATNAVLKEKFKLARAFVDNSDKSIAEAQEELKKYVELGADGKPVIVDGHFKLTPTGEQMDLAGSKVDGKDINTIISEKNGIISTQSAIKAEALQQIQKSQDLNAIVKETRVAVDNAYQVNTTILENPKLSLLTKASNPLMSDHINAAISNTQDPAVAEQLGKLNKIKELSLELKGDGTATNPGLLSNPVANAARIKEINADIDSRYVEAVKIADGDNMAKNVDTVYQDATNRFKAAFVSDPISKGAKSLFTGELPAAQQQFMNTLYPGLDLKSPDAAKLVDRFSRLFDSTVEQPAKGIVDAALKDYMLGNTNAADFRTAIAKALPLIPKK